MQGRIPEAGYNGLPGSWSILPFLGRSLKEYPRIRPAAKGTLAPALQDGYNFSGIFDTGLAYPVQRGKGAYF
jgi:hypothetical protein